MAIRAALVTHVFHEVELAPSKDVDAHDWSFHIPFRHEVAHEIGGSALRKGLQRGPDDEWT